MKRRFLYMILLMIPIVAVSGQIPPLSEVRKEYLGGWEGECGAEKLYQQLEDQKLENDPVMMAYRGAAKTTLANCTNNPFRKLSDFNSGKKEIESAVEQLPRNLEVRFIRFTVQDNIPSMLNYNNIDEDKEFILDQLSLQKQDIYPVEFLELVVHYLLNSDELDETEKNSVRAMLTKEK
jgi:hypothetical protein